MPSHARRQTPRPGDPLSRLELGVARGALTTTGLSVAGQYEGEKALNFAPRQVAACDALGALFPTAHVLLVTRGFRSLILSSYSQYARTGGAVEIEDFLRGGMPEHALGTTTTSSRPTARGSVNG